MNRLMFGLLMFGGLAVAADEAKEPPVVFQEDFSKGADRWEPSDPAAWKVIDDTGNWTDIELRGVKVEKK